MRNLIFLLITVSVIISTIFMNPFNKNTSAANTEKNWTIAIHGGAGTMSKNIPDSLKNNYLQSLETALDSGIKLLSEGGTALDVVEAVIKQMEDNPHFNAGKGAVFNAEGKHELDASIMDGSNLKNGAVAIVTKVKNPITLARLVMEKTNHVLLAGEGSDRFAEEMGVELVDNKYFDTPQRYEQWKKLLQNEKKGTVGAVVLDSYGNIAAGTSTGGTSNKLKGRIGDSPLINAGTYANNKTCGVSATGTGEKFITHTVAYNISALMEFKGLSLKEAADEIIFNRLEKGDGGIVAVDKDGNYYMPFNTIGMYRAAASSSGVKEVKIWE
jgi:L-asparaginase / beta-aspartyl-peptidase